MSKSAFLGYCAGVCWAVTGAELGRSWVGALLCALPAVGFWVLLVGHEVRCGRESGK